jgi:hypothetical protein
MKSTAALGAEIAEVTSIQWCVWVNVGAPTTGFTLARMHELYPYDPRLLPFPHDGEGRSSDRRMPAWPKRNRR